jgi:hypothetical protein
MRATSRVLSYMSMRFVQVLVWWWGAYVVVHNELSSRFMRLLL